MRSRCATLLGMRELPDFELELRVVAINARSAALIGLMLAAVRLAVGPIGRFFLGGLILLGARMLLVVLTIVVALLVVSVLWRGSGIERAALDSTQRAYLKRSLNIATAAGVGWIAMLVGTFAFIVM